VKQKPRVLLIGAGNMGMALLKGWLSHGHPRASIAVVDAADAPRRAAAELGIHAEAVVGQALLQAAEVIVLATKPQQLDEALHQCRVAAADERLFLSIAAGRRLAGIREKLGHAAALVRAMPNTPAAIGRGMTVLCAADNVGAVQRATCAELMAAVGATAWVEREELMDAVTAVSGSGPAYVFLLIEALTQAGQQAGLESALARELALETVAGSGEYARVAATDAAELRRRVTSPGGTTEAALGVLSAPAGGLVDLMGRAVRAAVQRSRELG
jgi:pyrroline-5-carboxylate reductase